MNILPGKSILLLLFAALLTFGSCAPGHKAANLFMENRDSIAIMVVPGNSLFLYYYPIDTSITEENSNGVSVENSKFLADIDTTLALNLFNTALLNQLKEYRFRIFTPEEFHQFLAIPERKFIFTIAQAEIIESDDIFEDRALIDTVLYKQEFLLRRLDRNTWFEFSEVDPLSDHTRQQVLFSTFFTSDQINGDFTYQPWSGDVYYKYSSYLLADRDVYELNRFAGQQNALYIMEFLLNRELQTSKPELKERNIYYRYNPATQSLVPDNQAQRFIILEP